MDEQTLLLNLLDSGLAHCRGMVEDHGGILTTLFVAGFFGSAGHCVTMCGPFVLAQTVARLESQPAAAMREFYRLTGAALTPYHVGRMTTYAGLGAVAAALAGGLVQVTGLRWMSAAFLFLAAIAFLAYGVRRIGFLLPARETGGEGWWARHVGRLARPLFERPVGLRGYGLGLALGFLPCGLLYGALAAVSSSGDALTGAFGMILFALGTVPALLVVGVAGHVAGRRWQTWTARVAPVLMVFNAGVLGIMGWRMLA